MTAPRLLLPVEAATLLGVSPYRLDRMRIEGEIVHVKMGRVLYDEVDVVEAAKKPAGVGDRHAETTSDARKWALKKLLLRRDTRKPRPT